MGLLPFKTIWITLGLRAPSISKRQSGFQVDRLDGVGDIICRANGATVLDIGCNRGMVSYELAQNGASVVHGCDIWEPGLVVAREVFSELPCKSLFVLADLSGGQKALSASFGISYRPRYDIVLFMAIYHKLKRTMPEERLSDLVRHIAGKAGQFLLLREPEEEAEEIAALVSRFGLVCIQRSTISKARGVATIWTPTNA
jgi:2-polyprenyl-3-methyl-5-hydroxy-6-metoxy-1,4-benzoquinol methylase